MGHPSLLSLAENESAHTTTIPLSYLVLFQRYCRVPAKTAAALFQTNFEVFPWTIPYIDNVGSPSCEDPELNIFVVLSN